MRTVTAVVALASGIVLSTASLAATVVPVAGKLSIIAALDFVTLPAPLLAKWGTP